MHRFKTSKIYICGARAGRDWLLSAQLKSIPASRQQRQHRNGTCHMVWERGTKKKTYHDRLQKKIPWPRLRCVTHTGGGVVD